MALRLHARSSRVLAWSPDVALEERKHPRTLGWLGTTAMAMGGSNQSLFLIGVLFVSQGSAAVPLLIVGLVLSWMAIPGWIELILMWPNRVGGIAATCAEAFRPYSPVLANLTGVCYWWGWVPTCGLTALALGVRDPPVVPAGDAGRACWPARSSSSSPASTSAASSGSRGSRSRSPSSRRALPLCSALVPIGFGEVDWHQATSFDLDVPFNGVFGT